MASLNNCSGDGVDLFGLSVFSAKIVSIKERFRISAGIKTLLLHRRYQKNQNTADAFISIKKDFEAAYRDISHRCIFYSPTVYRCISGGHGTRSVKSQFF